MRTSSNRWSFAPLPGVGFKTLLLVILSLAMMTLDRQAGHLDRVRDALGVVVYPVRAAVDLPYSAWHWLSTSLASRAALLDENAALKRQLLELSVPQQQLAALQAENVRLRELLDSSRRLEQSVQVASLLRADLDPFRHRVTLNRGSTGGVGEGMAILDAEGVVGQIVGVTPVSAEAVLISDPAHAIPVEINRNGVRTVALGTGDLNRLDLPFLANSADIEEGDLLVTSGLGGRFPRGYPVATVIEVRRDPGQDFAGVSAAPLARLDRLREVLLVHSPLPEDVLESEPEAEGQSAGETP